MAPPEGGLLSPREVAAWLRVSPRTVTRMADRGLLRSVKVGRQRRITYESLQAFVRAQEGR